MVRSSFYWIRHRNSFTEKAWKDAEQGLATLRVPPHRVIIMEFWGRIVDILAETKTSEKRQFYSLASCCVVCDAIWECNMMHTLEYQYLCIILIQVFTHRWWVYKFLTLEPLEVTQ